MIRAGKVAIRASFRSKHDIDVNKICNQFSGGGHAKAAGCRLDGLAIICA